MQATSASDRIRSLASVDHFRRRSTVEMISAGMYLTVLSHVHKYTKPHDPHRLRNPSHPQSREDAYGFQSAQGILIQRKVWAYYQETYILCVRAGYAELWALLRC